eukprot:scaffold5826_cov291-Prasinococcus_capsulatus_cf.AAC.1
MQVLDQAVRPGLPELGDVERLHGTAEGAAGRATARGAAATALPGEGQLRCAAAGAAAQHDTATWCFVRRLALLCSAQRIDTLPFSQTLPHVRARKQASKKEGLRCTCKPLELLQPFELRRGRGKQRAHEASQLHAAFVRRATSQRGIAMRLLLAGKCGGHSRHRRRNNVVGGLVVAPPRRSEHAQDTAVHGRQLLEHLQHVTAPAAAAGPAVVPVEAAVERATARHEPLVAGAQVREHERRRFPRRQLPHVHHAVRFVRRQQRPHLRKTSARTLSA